MDLNAYLHLMVQRQASDLFLSAGAPPSLKAGGETRHLGEARLTAEQVHAMAYAVMNERQQREFEATLEMNLAIALADAGRFRINIYRQRGDVAMVVRYITSRIPGIEALNLPPLLKELVLLPRGLVLVVGATSSGKSTCLASMLDHRNSVRTGHILTIEEPIEYLHVHKQSVVDQREIGLDTLSYANALKNAMREAPDVIMIGEIRDREIMQQAIAYAETGHLCLATLHASNASQALDRIVNFFAEQARQQLLIDLSLNLKAVVSLRLLRAVDGGRVPAVELLLATPYVSDLIAKGEIHKLRDAMRQGKELGMQSFDDALYRLYADGRIDYRQALDAADSRTDLALRLRLDGLAPPDDPGALRLDDFAGELPGEAPIR
ncbi:PilT/PilU family type 4a pilus ATPase [Fulvimonas soli]|jgi:twitching motility protein PilU|uniref:Twitching motility protein PilU n=1 Tax=Fulvimonas soli TaxID=155197 RepID=A0A316IB60_9GAMM|nr:PilT/PilU family type 4a pilus ATPase [Fulvimonas soli]PWK89732.1 twitching motility protein PilU [Fulvimonas soli]TNY27620.1 type IV pili twitching motility protein PilT [Fulvimonas soli]